MITPTKLGIKKDIKNVSHPKMTPPRVESLMTPALLRSFLIMTITSLILLNKIDEISPRRLCPAYVTRTALSSFEQKNMTHYFLLLPVSPRATNGILFYCHMSN